MAALGALRASAQDATWINPAGGEFFDPANWANGEIPDYHFGTLTVADFNLAAPPFTVTLDRQAFNDGFRLDRQDLTIDMAGFGYTIFGFGAGGGPDWATIENEAASLTVRNGLFDASNAAGIRTATAAASSMNIVIENATWRAPSVSIGQIGSGSLQISGGGRMEMIGGNLECGESAGSHGSIAVRGAGSTFYSNGTGVIGAGGAGTFAVEDGGVATFDSVAFIGQLPGSSGQAFVRGAGSSLIADAVNIGWSGDGSLAILDGGQVATRSTATIGSGTDLPVTDLAHGQVTVSGAGSAWHAGGGLAVGRNANGLGTLDISSGGSVDVEPSASPGQGLEVAATGTVNISGAGSRLHAGTIATVGGRMTISDGARADFDDKLFVLDPNPAAMNVRVAGGSTLSVSTSGTLQNSGVVVVEGGGHIELGTEQSLPDVFIDSHGVNSGESGSIAIAGVGSSYHNARGTAVGFDGAGTFSVSDGATATNLGRVYAGLNPGSRGVIEISGTNNETASTWTADTTSIGWQGAGTMSITAGGQLVNTSADNDCFIGFGAGSIDMGGQPATGIATVSGAGSRWTMAPTLHVGAEGVGTLNVTGGGAVQINNASGVPDALTISGSNGASVVSISGVNSRLTTVGNIVVDHGTLSAGAGGVGAGGGGGGGDEGGGTITTTANVLVGRAALWDATLTIGGAPGGSGGNDGAIAMLSVAGSLTVGGSPRGNGVSAVAVVGDGGAIDVAHTTTVRDRGRLLWNDGGHFASGELVVREHGRFTMSASQTPAAAKVLDVSQLSIVDDGAVDLSNNAAIVHAGTSGQIAGYIRTARGAGEWSGPGLTSSAASADANHATTIGVLSGIEFKSMSGGTAEFGGRAIADADVLAKYTYFGDTDFNGIVNFDDYVRTDNGFNNGLAGWMNGDFDLNGVVNFDDYVLIDLAFNTQSGTLRRAIAYLEGAYPDETDRDNTDRNNADLGGGAMSDPAMRRVEDHFERFGAAYASHFIAAVPEPSSITLLGSFVTSATALRRRRSINRRSITS